jgi:hypothetical protein
MADEDEKNLLQVIFEHSGINWSESEHHDYILKYCPLAKALGIDPLVEPSDLLDCRGCQLCDLNNFNLECENLKHLEKVLLQEKGEHANLADIKLLNSKLTFTPMIIHHYKKWDDNSIDCERQE